MTVVVSRKERRVAAIVVVVESELVTIVRRLRCAHSTRDVEKEVEGKVVLSWLVDLVESYCLC
jgi:hypothetical protein